MCLVFVGIIFSTFRVYKTDKTRQNNDCCMFISLFVVYRLLSASHFNIRCLIYPPPHLLMSGYQRQTFNARWRREAAAHANVANRRFILFCRPCLFALLHFPHLLHFPDYYFPLSICRFAFTYLCCPLRLYLPPYPPTPTLMSLVSSWPFTSSRPFPLCCRSSLPPRPWSLLPTPLVLHPLSSPSVSLLQSPSVPMCGWWCSWCCCWCQQ